VCRNRHHLPEDEQLYDAQIDFVIPTLTKASEMLSKKLATMSVSPFLFLMSHGVVVATTTAAFFGAGLLLLTHHWDEMRAALRLRPTATTQARRAPAGTTAATADQRAPTETTAATANQPAPSAVPPAVRPNDPTSPTIVVKQADPNLIAAFAREAANKGITLEQYREARLRFLRQQQAQLDLQLSDPKLSETETKRLERQRAYWGRAIEQTMALGTSK
jgi:hypothetical protein